MKISKGLTSQRLFWVLGGVLPLALFTVVMLFMFTQQQEKSIVRLLHEEANNSAYTLDSAIGEQLGLLRGLATSHALDTEDFAAFRLDALRLGEMHPEWQTVILTDEQQPIFNLHAQRTLPLPPLRDQTSLLKVWQTQKPYVENLANNSVAIRVPVIRNNQVKYTLVATIDPQFYLNTLLASYQVDHFGVIIVGSDDVVISASPEAPVTAGKTLPQQFRQNNQGTLSVGEMLYAAPITIRSGDWRIFVYVPAAFIQAPFAKKRLFVFLGGFLAAALTVILVLAISSAWAAGRETTRLHKEIEERKQAEEALRQSEKRFRLVVENAPAAIFVQTEGRFAYLNKIAAQLFGAQCAEDLIGESVIARFHPDFQETVRKGILQLNDEKMVVPSQHPVCLGLDDMPVNVELSVVPFEYDGKDGSLVFVRDMTESLKTLARQKELESQLYQAQKMEAVGRLAGGVAHDYNNMLSVIVGYSEMALGKTDPESPVHEYISQIHDAAIRSTAITRQLLAFARKQTIVPIALDLNKAIEGMFKMLRRLIGEDINLAWLPKAGVWPIIIDPMQIDQILANLCVNARDSINGVGRITIETDRATFTEAYCADHSGFIPGDYVLLAVSDDGCGMDRDTVDKIFEPFFTTKGIGHGTGLGLATVYGIIKQNNGFVNVYSEPGKGTTFKIYFARYTDPMVETSQEKPASLIPTGRGETILVVEDEVAILNLAKKILEDLGYKVLTTKTPSQALHLAKENSNEIQLLITDVVMPEMNGKDLSNQMLEMNPNLKVLFMSGYTANVIAQQGILDKGINFMPKPFSIESLAVKVEELLGS